MSFKKPSGGDGAAQAAQLAALQESNRQAQSEIDALRNATPVESVATTAAKTEAADAQKTIERNRKGRGSTLLTGGQGVLAETPGTAPQLKQLLG